MSLIVRSATALAKAVLAEKSGAVPRTHLETHLARCHAAPSAQGHPPRRVHSNGVSGPLLCHMEICSSGPVTFCVDEPRQNNENFGRAELGMDGCQRLQYLRARRLSCALR